MNSALVCHSLAWFVFFQIVEKMEEKQWLDSGYYYFIYF